MNHPPYLSSIFFFSFWGKVTIKFIAWEHDLRRFSKDMAKAMMILPFTPRRKITFSFRTRWWRHLSSVTLKFPKHFVAAAAAVTLFASHIFFKSASQSVLKACWRRDGIFSCIRLIIPMSILGPEAATAMRVMCQVSLWEDPLQRYKRRYFTDVMNAQKAATNVLAPNKEARKH